MALGVTHNGRVAREVGGGGGDQGRAFSPLWCRKSTLTQTHPRSLLQHHTPVHTHVLTTHPYIHTPVVTHIYTLSRIHTLVFTHVLPLVHSLTPAATHVWPLLCSQIPPFFTLVEPVTFPSINRHLPPAILHVYIHTQPLTHIISIPLS